MTSAIAIPTKSLPSDATIIYIERIPLTDGSHVYNVLVSQDENTLTFPAVDEAAAWRISDTFRDMLTDDDIALAFVETSCNY